LKIWVLKNRNVEIYKLIKKTLYNSHYNGFGHLAEWKVGFVFGIFGKSEEWA
jgi:hypothetical protein